MTRAAQGLRGWLLQRFSAIFIAGYLLVILPLIYFCQPADYTEWRAWLGHPLMSSATALFAVALVVHAWIGIRDVLIDYVHPIWLRFSIMSLFGLILLTSLALVARALTLAITSTMG